MHNNTSSKLTLLLFLTFFFLNHFGHRRRCFIHKTTSLQHLFSSQYLSSSSSSSSSQKLSWRLSLFYCVSLSFSSFFILSPKALSSKICFISAPPAVKVHLFIFIFSSSFHLSKVTLTCTSFVFYPFCFSFLSCYVLSHLPFSSHFCPFRNISFAPNIIVSLKQCLCVFV